VHLDAECVGDFLQAGEVDVGWLVSVAVDRVVTQPAELGQRLTIESYSSAFNG